MEKKIHYCWFGGKKLPKKIQKYIKTWKKFLPEYEIVEWNEKNFDINICPFVKEAYENKNWAFVSDYARIYALYNYGGLYLDTDVKIIKDISNILEKDMFLGYEDSGLFGTAVIGVKEKNNKYIKEILDFYNDLDGYNPEIMYNYANPTIITKSIKKYNYYTTEKGIEVYDNNIYIYPRDYFFPLSYNYAEREFSENTCMIHLFNATWTSLGERRTVGIYRKLGPDLGRLVNNFIDRLGNLKFKIKKIILNIFNSCKMWYSIHINRKKRVERINEKLKEIKSEQIVICNPDKGAENQYINVQFDNNILFLREQHTEKEASIIAKLIVEHKKNKIIFNSFSNGWNKLASNIKKNDRNVNIEVLIHGGNERNANRNIWQLRDDVLVLYDKKKIDKLLFFNKNMYEFYKEKGYNAGLLKRKAIINDVDKYQKNEERKYIKVGMYVTGYDASNNNFNQLGAVSLLENAKLDFNPINYEISMMARRLNIQLFGDSKVLSQEELYYKLADNDINLCIGLIDDDSLIPIQSLELGTLCIIGRGCKLFENSELEKYIKVEDEEDIIGISKKIKEVLENKDTIFKLYDSWKKEEK